MLDAHLGERVGGDDDRRDDLHEAGAAEGRPQAGLELDQLRRPAAGAQLLQEPAPVSHEAVLELFERRVAGRHIGEDPIQHARVGAELAQALRLRRREAHADGLVRGHVEPSSGCARAR